MHLSIGVLGEKQCYSNDDAMTQLDVELISLLHNRFFWSSDLSSSSSKHWASSAFLPKRMKKFGRVDEERGEPRESSIDVSSTWEREQVPVSYCFVYWRSASLG
jgi:hypothetical protein